MKILNLGLLYKVRMLLKVTDNCVEGKRVLAALMPSLSKKFNEENTEVHLPCDILDERFAHVLVPVYIEASLLGVKLIEVSVDPGAARCGVALAVGEKIVGAFTLPQQALIDFLTIVKQHFDVRLYWGGAITPIKVIAENTSNVIYVDEGDLPLVKLEDYHLGDHEHDALRILVKGRLQLADTKLKKELMSLKR